MGNAKDNGGRKHSLRGFTPEQVSAFKKMICLSEHLRREVMDMVVFFELVEHDSGKARAVKEALDASLT